MHCQVLSSGSRGNATLIRAGDTRLLVDAGLSLRELRARLEAARVPHRGIDHVLVSHGHLDHARSAGALALASDATVHCPEGVLQHRSVARAPRHVALRIGATTEIAQESGEPVRYTPIPVPHDCHPTVAFKLEHAERRLVLLTDIGRPCETTARALAGAHVLVLEFNHDAEMLAGGPYPATLKHRVSGAGGHLSNAQAQLMLRALAGRDLHTLILGHLSRHNNTPTLALAAARATLEELGLHGVEVLVASQDEIGPNIPV